MSEETPTEGQRTAMRLIAEFLSNDPPGAQRLLTISGGAGVGKTTLIGMVRDRVRKAIIAAPTNKAVGALRRRGFEGATTVDKVINRKVYTGTRRPPHDIEIAYYQENGARVPAFIIVDSYETIDNQETGLVVIVDEGSMTDTNTLARLLVLYRKVIIVGDGFQLPPVEGEAWFQSYPHDIELTEPVRTTADSQIYQLANMIRGRDKAWRGHAWDDQQVVIIPKWQHAPAAMPLLRDADLVLAFKNDTCDSLNPFLRSLRELEPSDDPTRPVKGDYLLSWVNHKEIKKSERYQVIGASPIPAGYQVRLRDDEQNLVLTKVNKATLQQQKSTIHVDGCQAFSYGHCMTTHKSQSGEWDRVVVLESDKTKRHEDYWNWFYTAVSRAKKHLTILT